MSMEKMKVVALGGCGGMGRYAVKSALEYSFVDEIGPLCTVPSAKADAGEMLLVTTS
ncbi:MAG: hypothetical protein GY866_38900 [Proteobacteria bacterium]|nr:hypothetical protein [Pseudomonadota bacterium]